jgi:hypothetical protein
MRPEEYTDDDVIEYLVHQQVRATVDLIRLRVAQIASEESPEDVASAFVGIKTTMSLKGWVPSVR